MTMREAALALASRGFKVFPITAGAKAPPLVSGWQREATTDASQVDAWWVQWPEANIGIHCDGLLVIDVDPKKGGYDSLDALEKEIVLEATYEVESYSGGRHIYYRLAEGSRVKNGVDILGRGVDVRTTGGYVIGAGSVVRFDAEGRLTEPREYRVVADEPIADADPALVARCAARVVEPVEVPAEAANTDPDAAVGRAVEYLRTAPVAIEGQGGNLLTYQTACRVRDFGVPQARAAEALAEWNARCEPPWEAEELAVVIRNAYKYAQDPAGKLTPEALGFEPIVDAPAEPVKEKSAEPRRLIHPSEINLGELLNVDYFIKGVLDRQSNAVIFGHWNVGKSFIVLDMAAVIACGIESWFGRRVRRGRVLYVGYEGIRALRKRIYALREKYPALLDPGTPFEYAAFIEPLTLDAGVEELGKVLREFVRKHGGPPDLVIVDTLSAALGGDDSDAELMAKLNRFVGLIMKKQRCTVLRVHHSGHSNTERARGTSQLPAGIDTEIRVEDGEVCLTKQRDDVKGGASSFKLTVVRVGTDSDGDAVTTCVVEYIEPNPLDPRLTRPQRELLDSLLELCGEGGHVSKSDVRNSTPDGMTPKARKQLTDVLVSKRYLRVDGDGWIVSERGPLSIFD